MNGEDDIGYQVELFVYDLSRGIAKTMSPTLLGKEIEGIWHTGVVAYGREYFYGAGGIESCRPGGTILGDPDRVEELGESQVPYQLFLEYIFGLGEATYKPGSYDLLKHNCNNFSDEVSQFLCGRGIPKQILQLPDEVLNTSLGETLSTLVKNLDIKSSGSRKINFANYNNNVHGVVPGEYGRQQQQQQQQGLGQRGDSPDLELERLNQAIDQVRQNTLRLEDRRNSINEKVNKHEKKKKEKRDKREKKEKKEKKKKKKKSKSSCEVPEDLEGTTATTTAAAAAATTSTATASSTAAVTPSPSSSRPPIPLPPPPQCQPTGQCQSQTLPRVPEVTVTPAKEEGGGGGGGGEGEGGGGKEEKERASQQPVASQKKDSQQPIAAKEPNSQPSTAKNTDSQTKPAQKTATQTKPVQKTAPQTKPAQKTEQKTKVTQKTATPTKVAQKPTPQTNTDQNTATASSTEQQTSPQSSTDSQTTPGTQTHTQTTTETITDEQTSSQTTTDEQTPTQTNTDESTDSQTPAQTSTEQGTDPQPASTGQKTVPLQTASEEETVELPASLDDSSSQEQGEEGVMADQEDMPPPAEEMEAGEEDGEEAPPVEEEPRMESPQPPPEPEVEREPPITFKEHLDAREEFECLVGVCGSLLNPEEQAHLEELRAYVLDDEGSWALGENFSSLLGRVLHDGSIPDEARVHLVRVMAAAALKDDVILLLHQDRKDHTIMNYANKVEFLSPDQQEALALFFCNMFEHISPSEWLLYISEWQDGNQPTSNIRVTTKIAVNALLNTNPKCQDYGSAIMYNLGTKEVKTVVFDDVAPELAMAILQFFSTHPQEELLWRTMAALCRFTYSSTEVPALIKMIGPEPSTFRGASERVDALIEEIDAKLSRVRQF